MQQLTAHEFLAKAKELSEEDGYSFIYDSVHHHMKMAKLPDWYEHDVYVSPDFRTLNDEEFDRFVSEIDGKISSTWMRSIVEILGEHERT